MKISIILTSINRPEYLKRAINAVLNQSYKDWELICVDYSTEEKAKNEITLFCEHTAMTEKRFLFVNRLPLTKEEDSACTPYAKIINEARKLVSGDWITYLCDDDWYLPNHLEKIADAAQKHNAEIVYTGEWIADESIDLAELTKDKNAFLAKVGHLPAVLKRRCLYFTVDHNCVAHTLHLFDQVGGWEESVNVRKWGDAEFWYKLAMTGRYAYPTGSITVVKTQHKHGMQQTGGYVNEQQAKA